MLTLVLTTRHSSATFDLFHPYSLARKDKYWQDGNDCMKQNKIKPEVKFLVSLKDFSFGVLSGAFSEFYIWERAI